MPTRPFLLLPLLVASLSGCPGTGKDPDSPDRDSVPEDTAPIDTGTAPLDSDGDGYVAGEDCNDADGSVYPGAPETWYDGVDADCGGDDDFDADGDGHATPDGGGDDCDDALAGVHPGHAEVCGNGLDDDCSGDGAGCLDPLADAPLEAGPATLRGEAAGDGAGAWVSRADVDLDGLPDLLVTAPGNDAAYLDAGVVYLLFEAPAGDVSLADADARILGDQPGAGAGTRAEGLGDVDGDAFEDLVVTAPVDDRGGEGAGVAFVVRGPFAGPTSLAFAASTWVGDAAGMGLGATAVGAGDLDANGLPDLALGAPLSDACGADAGCAWVVGAPMTGPHAIADATARLLGEQPGDRAGAALDAAGDMDGDGLPELLVGAPAHPAGTGPGAVYVVEGPVAGDVRLSAIAGKLTGEIPGDLFGGTLVGVGDTNGDGYDDLLAGSPGTDRVTLPAVGAAWLVLGPVSAAGAVADVATASVRGEASGDLLGTSLEGADLDGDGLVDLVAGAPGVATGAMGGGAVLIFAGPLAGTLDPTTAVHLTGSSPGLSAGTCLSAIGDLNGDGPQDLLVGGPGLDAGAGGAFLVLGGGGP